jgi:6-pyruvoyltetrahydropterin/6-carboxytetrahydropterin synthase
VNSQLATRFETDACPNTGRKLLFELSQSFYFEAAHSLVRPSEVGYAELEASRRIHGHTYIAHVTVSAQPEPATGISVDLGIVRAHIARARALLDHRLLDGVPDLGPATLENLCVFIWRTMSAELDGITRVSVSREVSGDSCVLHIGEKSYT